MEKTALIIDDDALVRHLLGSMLESLGYAVESVDSGAAARAHFAANPKSPAVIFLDLFMADITGPELLVELRALVNSKIGIISANPKSEAGDFLQNNEADFYLEKPFKAADVSKVLSELFTDS